MTDLEHRPRPVRNAAATVAGWVGVLGAFVTSLVGFGVLTIAQGDAVTGLLGAVPGVVTWVVAAIAAFQVSAKAEPLVTPLVSPQNNQGVRLVPERHTV
jgi:hypothetical protein